MLSFVTTTLCCEVVNTLPKRMPRVVSDQRDKYENDELFRKLSRESEVKYTGFRDRPLEERQLRLQTECREGHASMAFLSTGTNMLLSFSSNAWSDKAEERVPTQEFVDFEREPGKVFLKSQFIMNGVCVIWRGWVDLNRLDGVACIEFDEERAQVENALLREQIEQYNRRLRDIEDRQRQYRDEQERRAEAEAEAYLKLVKEKNLPLHNQSLDPRGQRKDSQSRGQKKPGVEVRIPVPVKPVAVNNGINMYRWKHKLYIV